MISAVTHVALRVTDVREAEEYYCELLDLEAAFRDAPTEEGWAMLPPEAGWDEAPVELDVVMLYRDGLRLALERVEQVEGLGLLSHVGLQIDEGELRRLRGRVDAVHDHEQGLIFHDRYGVRWELSTYGYDDPPSLSMGARTGRWLEVGA